MQSRQNRLEQRMQDIMRRRYELEDHFQFDSPEYIREEEKLMEEHKEVFALLYPDKVNPTYQEG